MGTEVLMTLILVLLLPGEIVHGSIKTPARDPNKCYSDLDHEMEPKRLHQLFKRKCMLFYCDPESKTLLNITCADFRSPCVHKGKTDQYPYCCNVPRCPNK